MRQKSCFYSLIILNPYEQYNIIVCPLFQACRYVLCLKVGMNAAWVLSENDRILKYTKRRDKKSTNKKPGLNIESSCVQNITSSESFNVINSKPLDASGCSLMSYQVNANSSFYDMPSVDQEDASGDLQPSPSHAFSGVQPNVARGVTQGVDLMDSNFNFCKLLTKFYTFKAII